MSENDSSTPETVTDDTPEPTQEFTQAFAPHTTPDTGAEHAAADGAENSPEDGAADGAEDSANREAAKWRKKLRDAESQRDTITTRLENMQRAAIDSQITAMGMKPAALWASGAQLEDLLDKNGVPDADKVQKAADTAKETLGVTIPRKSLYALRSGAGVAPPKRNNWVAAFGPRDE